MKQLNLLKERPSMPSVIPKSAFGNVAQYYLIDLIFVALVWKVNQLYITLLDAGQATERLIMANSNKAYISLTSLDDSSFSDHSKQVFLL